MKSLELIPSPENYENGTAMLAPLLQATAGSCSAAQGKPRAP